MKSLCYFLFSSFHNGDTLVKYAYPTLFFGLFLFIGCAKGVTKTAESIPQLYAYPITVKNQSDFTLGFTTAEMWILTFKTPAGKEKGRLLSSGAVVDILLERSRAGPPHAPLFAYVKRNDNLITSVATRMVIVRDRGRAETWVITNHSFIPSPL